MGFQISPGVEVREFDLTGLIPAVSTTQAALAGDFKWGPINVPVLVDSEKELVETFWKPVTRNADDWFTAWNFLNYGNQLYVVRVVDEDNANTALRAKNATVGNSNGILVTNDEVYNENYKDGSLDTLFNTGEWIAKFAGEMGNSLKVSVCASANAYQSTLSGTLSVTSGNNVVTGANTDFATEAVVGDIVSINNESHVIQSITNSSQLILRDTHIQGASANTVVRHWQYFLETDVAPGTSLWADERGASDDELHVVVVDEDGKWTGTKGEVLEVFSAMSLAEDAKYENGSTAYYLEVVNQKSRYVRWASHAGTLTNAGKSISDAEATTFGRPALPLNYSLSGGNDGGSIGNDEKIRGYDFYKSAEDIDISLILGSSANQTIATYLINNIAEVRRDCVVFLSPPRANVVDNVGSEASSIITFRNLLPSSSYAFLDSGWKNTYDKWNDVYRYVPLNGDVAGLAVRTDNDRDPWWAFAGLNRGQIKNAIKLAWNPRLADRDQLYKNAINPVITSPGDGTILWGNKTLLSKPSAFDRINVRRLFIVLEKAIAKAARFLVFEFNDEFSRSLFKSMVEPFLRDVQGRRGIIDFRVVCDETNNTPEVIDDNRFVGDIYIKPNKTAEFITLNFVAVRTGVNFEEIIGKFGG